jgi:NADH:ubiquinone oxidoreductase subunit C
MGTEEALAQAEIILKKFTKSISHPEVNRLDVVIDRDQLTAAVQALLIDGHWGYLSAITGLDNPTYLIDVATSEKKIVPDTGSLELLYHFCLGAAITTLRVTLPYADPTVDTVCNIVSSATLYEREAAELLGITFTGTPNTDRLILADSWPVGVYPLRKSFTGLEKKDQIQGAIE